MEHTHSQYKFSKKYKDEDFVLFKKLDEKEGYIFVPHNIIREAEKIILSKSIDISDPKRAYKPQKEYLFQDKYIIKIIYGRIEIHSKTEKGLEKLIEFLGLPKK